MTLRDEMRLVAVYDTEDDARAAVRALERSGVDTGQVRVADDRDHVSAVEGEMRSETENVVSKEVAQGSLLGILIGAVVGFLLALPVAIIGVADLSVWLGAVLVECIGILLGTTVGWLIGTSFAAKRPDEPLAAERGTTVAVPLSNEAEATLTTTNPRRIDIVEADGHAVSVVAERDQEHLVRDIARHMRGEERRG